MNQLVVDIWPMVVTAALAAIGTYIGFIHRLRIKVSVMEVEVAELKRRVEGHSKRQDDILNAINENAKYLMTGGGSAVMQMPANTSRMAAAVIGIIPILIIYPFFQDYFVKGITMGAVKG